LFILAID